MSLRSAGANTAITLRRLSLACALVGFATGAWAQGAPSVEASARLKSSATTWTTRVSVVQPTTVHVFAAPLQYCCPPMVVWKR